MEKYDLAIEQYRKVLEKDPSNSYAYNNMGKIYEDRLNYEKAFEYYVKSADLGESWACNKIGEYYRLGIGVKKNMELSFNYYNMGMDAHINYLCYYNHYNLGKYFYFNGNPDINVEKDVDKAIKLLDMAGDSGIMEANTLLLYYYVDLYLSNKDKSIISYINRYRDLVEISSGFNSDISLDIENKIKEIKNREIDISFIYD